METNRRKESLILIIHNVRSAHNVGAMFRTADGAGADRIFLTGYTPPPPKQDASYLTDAEKSFRKTALGAEAFIPWKKSRSFARVFFWLRKDGYQIIALEQSGQSIGYRRYVPKGKVALIVGNEVHGINRKILNRCDATIEIPMYGTKNSLNVSVAAGVALYQIRATMKERAKRSKREKKHL